MLGGRYEGKRHGKEAARQIPKRIQQRKQMNTTLTLLPPKNAREKASKKKQQ